ncbi:hypothetical protein [Paucibacter soli]|uniref:hypothetical protein n=1 Tax=Paucibacter soli TaxID=3133433 RepID=UPI00309ADFD5
MATKIEKLMRRLVKAEILLSENPKHREARAIRAEIKKQIKVIANKLSAGNEQVQLSLPIAAAWGAFHHDGSAHLFQQREAAEAFGPPAALFTHPWQMPLPQTLAGIFALEMEKAGLSLTEEVKAACLKMMGAAITAAADPVLGGLVQAQDA